MYEDEEDYGDIADEDFMQAESFSQPSSTLPALPSPPPAKRRWISHHSIESGHSGDEGRESSKKKMSKYRIHIAEKDVPAAKIIGATQAEALPDSSPWRMRGPIYKRSRPEPPPKSPTFSATPRRSKPQSANLFQKRNSAPAEEHDYSRELEDLPSDAFSSPDDNAASREAINIGSSPVPASQAGPFRSQRLVAPQQGLRQTTLFGGRAPDEVPASQVKKVYNFIADKPPEEATHHKLDLEALKTWVYPTNLGTIRDYQYSIVKHGLFNNLLVALPTGLGKTFIAATIMLNFFRWTKDSKIVFVAPTKPLVAQQVDACFNIVGIPRSQTTMLTGDQPPPLRAEEWESKRVFFMTPQTLQNDLATGIADPKKIALLVVDEAHRATGNYAYCTVVSFLRRFNKSFRVLALTATPGASVEAVQEVIDNLEISKVEIRTEESIDIQQYVHDRNIDQIVLEPSDEMILVKDLFSKALQPLVNILCSQNAFYSKDPMSLTPFGMLQARKKWMADTGRTASMGLKGMMNGLFAVLGSIAHSIKLLNFHGIGPFYQTIKEFRSGVEDRSKPSKYKSQIIESPDFKKMMDRIQMWLTKDDFVGHPKLTSLCESVLNHFLDAGAGRLGDDAPPSSTRVIVFAEYRDSAADIVRVLNRHGPMIRAKVFVGQADSKRSEGMNQIKQQEAIDNFKAGKTNVLVATSIGEEGLDIGQVDLIVCYDASASPIRMLQRMGRTGRKRAGHIVLLLMKGKEEQAFVSAKDNYEQMQKMISSGARFNFRHDLSVRILPRDITPVVNKSFIDIPIENTQGPALPEPKRRAMKGKKMPPKKFHMPDGVETGFRMTSNLHGKGRAPTDLGVAVKRKTAPKTQEDSLVPIIPPESVFLTPAQEQEFIDKYINVCDDDSQEVCVPENTKHPLAQRSLGPAVNVPHSRQTRRSVKLFSVLAKSQKIEDRYVKPFGDVEPCRSFWDPEYLVEDEAKITKGPRNRKVPRAPKAPKAAAKSKVGPAKRKPPSKKKQTLAMSDIESDAEDMDPTSSARPHLARDGSISGDDSEGQGDEIDSEERSEDEDSDLGSLKDFLADGSSPRTQRKSRMAGSSTTPPPNTAPIEKSFFVPTQFTDIQSSEDEDEMPDVQTLLEKKKKMMKRGSKVSVDLLSDSDQNEEEEEDNGPVQRQRKRKHRAIVESDRD